ncbi:unnamed protein product [Heligmosomoides polygyrus]|uniref:ubiquitinyl hydrolase 1 n=1 Tax=Heligmosomoides polygyrus TaxID=6339 RepID=A0A183GCK7_HELPZ|nr:unnamed protein product [Heligmosomoides polygyrus]
MSVQPPSFLKVNEMSHKAQPPVFAPIKSPPPAYNAKPAPLAVTFRETGGGPTMEEQCTIEHIRSFLGSSDFDEDLCLKAIRAQGCANRPMQTIEEAAAEMANQAGTVNVVPVASTGSAATSTTPLPALTSAAEREQSDIEKAIAESLISQGPPGNRSYISSLPANPEDMLRKEGVSKDEVSEADLVEKMRYLFATMDLGNRRYIDPSDALNVVSALAARSRSDVILGRQQDASEMMSSLMEWMEKGLIPQAGEEPHLDADNTKNVAKKSLLFLKQSPAFPASSSVEAMETSPNASVEQSSVMDTATAPDASKVEEIDVTNSWNKLEYTSLIPVHVSHGNLHDALEAHQFLNDSGKEPWFESLPAVLIFSLGRYFFNGTKGETEKLNMRFHFPRTIFMDRYMASNYECISEIREARNRLRQELANVRAELKGMNEFPVGDHTEKLVNILRATLNFAKGVEVNGSPAEQMDVGTGVIALPGPLSVNKPQSFVEQKPAVAPSLANSQKLSAIVPELEVSIKELETKHSELCARERELINSVDEIYEREELKQHGYRLHAVAIHQGQANAGHYWAYIRKGNDDSQWEKFNDQRVESAAWSDIEAEAIGGLRTTSAYFLLYVSSAAEPWLFSSDRPTASFLIDDVRERVESENAALEEEIERYRCTQNEDGKGNAVKICGTLDEGSASESGVQHYQGLQNDAGKDRDYEILHEGAEGEFCPPPPPIGNHEDMLTGTPSERAIADPENIAVSLSTYCEPWYSESAFDQEKRKLFSLLEFNGDTYPVTLSSEAVIDSQAKMMYRNVLKPMLMALIRKAESSSVRPDAKEVYNKVICGFYDEAEDVISPARSRSLRCVLDFWATVGFRAPAKTIRFAIVRSLLNAESEGIRQCAREELDEFVSVPYADHYIVLFQRISHLYDLLKTLWACIRQVASEMNHNNGTNFPRLSLKAVEMNVKVLKMVRSVTLIYNRVYLEVGNFQFQKIGARNSERNDKIGLSPVSPRDAERNE